jgi:hypothetical protein
VLSRSIAILERIVAEDVGDLGADHRAKAIVQQRPGCVLARGTAAEIAAADKDVAACGVRLIECEVRAWYARGIVAPVIEEMRAQSLAGGGA